MTAPIWRGEVEMRWDGERLMIGSFMIGNVTSEHSGDGLITWLLTSTGSHRSNGIVYPTEAEASSALVTAAVRALGGGE